MDLGLAGKKAILVGAARGIGYSVAEVLAREGCDIALTARSEDSVKDAVASLSKYGTKVVGKPVNAKQPEAYKEWIDWAIEELDGVDILVPFTSAGGGMGSEKYWYNAFETDVMAVVRAVEGVIEKMTEQQRGSIVLLGTTSTGEAMGGPQPYNAMKASLITWGKQLALWHGKNGIRVNVVNPDAVIRGSRIWDGKWKEERAASNKIDADDVEEFYRKRSMLKLAVLPEDIAEAVYFFASDKSGKSTGNILNVDAGNAAAFTR